VNSRNLVDIKSHTSKKAEEKSLILSWNCQGLARASAKRNLRALIRDIGRNRVFLSKTKIPISRSKKFLESLGFYNMEYVDPKGKKGGLVVCWKIRVDLEVTTIYQSYCSQFTSYIIKPHTNCTLYVRGTTLH